MERLTRNRVARGLIGIAMLGNAALLTVETVEAANSTDRRPDGLVFQDSLTDLAYTDSSEDAEFSNYELLNGFALNVLAISGLTGAGIGLLRRRRNAGQGAAEAQGNQPQLYDQDN